MLGGRGGADLEPEHGAVLHPELLQGGGLIRDEAGASRVVEPTQAEGVDEGVQRLQSRGEVSRARAAAHAPCDAAHVEVALGRRASAVQGAPEGGEGGVTDLVAWRGLTRVAAAHSARQGASRPQLQRGRRLVRACEDGGRHDVGSRRGSDYDAQCVRARQQPPPGERGRGPRRRAGAGSVALRRRTRPVPDALCHQLAAAAGDREDLGLGHALPHLHQPVAVVRKLPPVGRALHLCVRVRLCARARLAAAAGSCDLLARATAAACRPRCPPAQALPHVEELISRGKARDALHSGAYARGPRVGGDVNLPARGVERRRVGGSEEGDAQGDRARRRAAVQHLPVEAGRGRGAPCAACWLRQQQQHGVAAQADRWVIQRQGGRVSAHQRRPRRLAPRPRGALRLWGRRWGVALRGGRQRAHDVVCPRLGGVDPIEGGVTAVLPQRRGRCPHELVESPAVVGVHHGRSLRYRAQEPVHRPVVAGPAHVDANAVPPHLLLVPQALHRSLLTQDLCRPVRGRHQRGARGGGGGGGRSVLLSRSYRCLGLGVGETGDSTGGFEVRAPVHEHVGTLLPRGDCQGSR